MSKPQGGHANKHNKRVVRALWVSWQYSSCNDDYCHRSTNCHNASATNASRRQPLRRGQSLPGRNGGGIMNEEAPAVARVDGMMTATTATTNNKDDVVIVFGATAEDVDNNANVVVRVVVLGPTWTKTMTTTMTSWSRIIHLYRPMYLLLPLSCTLGIEIWWLSVGGENDGTLLYFPFFPFKFDHPQVIRGGTSAS